MLIDPKSKTVKAIKAIQLRNNRKHSLGGYRHSLSAF